MFDAPFMTAGVTLKVKCAHNPETDANEWHSQVSEDNLVPGLLDCNYQCTEDPPADDTKWQREWTIGQVAIGSRATYNCIGQWKKDAYTE